MNVDLFVKSADWVTKMVRPNIMTCHFPSYWDHITIVSHYVRNWIGTPACSSAGCVAKMPALWETLLSSNRGGQALFLQNAWHLSPGDPARDHSGEKPRVPTSPGRADGTM